MDSDDQMIITEITNSRKLRCDLWESKQGVGYGPILNKVIIKCYNQTPNKLPAPNTMHRHIYTWKVEEDTEKGGH